MSSSTEEEAKRIFEGDEDSLWVQEGRIDFPVVLGERPDTRDSSKIAAVVAFVVDFGGGSGDGFIQLKPLDKERTRRSVWWSSDEPIVFDFRASVKAKGIKAAWPRARSFVEQALDRVSFLAGAPARLLSYGMLYNETQLGQCRDGARATVLTIIKKRGIRDRPTMELVAEAA